ncbi:MAG: sigma-70 family RNA polymerase sigma factor [Acidiferrobacterales bacterium]
MSARQLQFEALVTAFSDDLYRYALWLCHRRELAEDLVQETFARAWKSLDGLQDHRAAKGWLLTILRRENARYHQRAQREGIPVDGFDPEQAIGADLDPGSAEIVMLRKALMELSDDYLEPLLLQVIGGYTSAEIAETMGISPGTVTTRLFRARKRLRKCLEGDAPENTRSSTAHKSKK